MSTYVIGDIQGCYQELARLLDKIGFGSSDNLWLVGDLINRGPRNREVLDLVMSLDNVTCVLGNHDLHFLAVAVGAQSQKRGDTFGDLLTSDRLPEYIEYIRSLPLLHYIEADNLVMVHAGIPPQFSISRCRSLAAEVESTIRADGYKTFLTAMYGNEPDEWCDDLEGMARLRLITNYFTRLRYCTAEGRLELTHKAAIAPPGFEPWFTFPREDGLTVLFGHWAALNGKTGTSQAIALDTGCIWGRELMALRLEDQARFSIPAMER